MSIIPNHEQIQDVDYLSRAVLKVTGTDALKFFQNIITNDIFSNNYCYTFMLNHTGRYLFDFFVYVQDNGSLFVDISLDCVKQFQKRITFYKMRSDVVLEDLTSEYKVVYSRHKLDGSIFSERDPRYLGLGIRSIVRRESGALGSGLYLEDKYRFGIIDGDMDLVAEKSIPIEYGADLLNAISYTKGCYIGQEVISRTKYQGTVRKEVFILHSSGADLSCVDRGASVLGSDGRLIGTYCSGRGSVGLGILRNDRTINAPIYIGDVEVVKLEIPEWRL